MSSVARFVRENWKEAAKWLSGALIGLLLAKACDLIWPDSPIVVKEVADTVRFVHTITPLPSETDSIFNEQIQRQLLNIELIRRYEEGVQRIQATRDDSACKLITGDSYPNSQGFTQKSSSAFCFIELVENKPFIDILYRFIRDDYDSVVNTLGLLITSNTATGDKVFVLDQHFEPQKGGKQIVRLVDDFPPGDYTIRAGFILKEDKDAKYPAFYSQQLKFSKH